MAGPDNPRRKALSVSPTSGDYAVGYGKPPAKTRFQKGQSGNPRGRPKGSRNRSKVPTLNEERMKSILLEEAYRTIRLNEGNAQVTIPMAQAVIRSLAVNAAKGNQRAQRLFTELLFTTERENKRLHDDFLDAAISYKVRWERELERRQRLGTTGPEPLPHPDHVIVDIRTGEVAIKGPATPEEKARWDWMHERKQEYIKEVEELEQLLLDEPDYPYKDQVIADIEHNTKIINMIRRVMPD
jgi:hypothetical protein